MNYGYSKTTDLSYEAAIEKATDVLKQNGFGVLTTIDVKETLKKKLDVDFDRYIILGACSPSSANAALRVEATVGLLMPCNVVIHEKDGKVNIYIFNPLLISQVSDNPELKELSVALNEKIQRVLSQL
jgi:uncharacterized protein (DUF302 family)